MNQYIICEVASQKIAIPISDVIQVTRVVAIKPLGQTRKHHLGVIDVQGAVICVVSLRSLLNLPAKEIALSDFLLILKMEEQRIALLIDQVDNTAFGTTKECENQQLLTKAQALHHFVDIKGEFMPCYNFKALFKEVDCDLQPSS